MLCQFVCNIVYFGVSSFVRIDLKGGDVDGWKYLNDGIQGFSDGSSTDDSSEALSSQRRFIPVFVSPFFILYFAQISQIDTDLVIFVVSVVKSIIHDSLAMIFRILIFSIGSFSGFYDWGWWSLWKRLKVGVRLLSVNLFTRKRWTYTIKWHKPPSSQSFSIDTIFVNLVLSVVP